MVYRLQATIDDEMAERAKRVKETHEWTWTEFVENATVVFEESINESDSE